MSETPEARIEPASIADVKELVNLPTITDLEGKVYTAQRKPLLGPNLAFLEALQLPLSLEVMTVQLREAKNVLLSMGFPPELLDGLEARYAVDCATHFFLAALGYRPASAT